MEARYNCCKVIQKAFIMSSKVSSDPALAGLAEKGAGKSAVLNSLIGHPVLPTGENGATRAPVSIDRQRDASLSSKSIILQIDNKSQQVSTSALRHSLQGRLGNATGKSQDGINLKLRTSTGINGGCNYFSTIYALFRT